MWIFLILKSKPSGFHNDFHASFHDGLGLHPTEYSHTRFRAGFRIQVFTQVFAQVFTPRFSRRFSHTGFHTSFRTGFHTQAFTQVFAYRFSRSCSHSGFRTDVQCPSDVNPTPFPERKQRGFWELQIWGNVQNKPKS